MIQKAKKKQADLINNPCQVMKSKKVFVRGCFDLLLFL